MGKSSKYIDYLIILGVLLTGMWQLVFGQAMMKWDIMDLYLPNNNFVTEALNNGKLPLWNPFVNSGFSQMGDPATWYPISWLLGFIFRYNLNTVHFEFLMHLYIAGIGLYKIGESKQFSRVTRIVLAVAYMFSGFFIGNAQHMTWVVSAAWFPWVIYYFTRLQSNPGTSVSMKLSLVLFLMLTGGYPGLFISTGYLLGGYLIYYLSVSIRNRQYDLLKKQTLFLMASVAVFLVLSAVAIYSAFYVAPLVTRGGGLEYADEAGGILMGSMPPKALLSFIYPLATAKNDMDFWGTDFSMLNSYFGICSLVLLIFINTIKKIPREIRYYTLIGIFFLLLSMAEVFPFRKWLLVLPFMDLFRFSSLFRLFYIFFFLIVSGHALEIIFRDLRIRARFFNFVIGFSIVLLAVNVSVLFMIDEWNFREIFSEDWTFFLNKAGIKERIFLQGCIAVSVLLLMAFIIRQKQIGRANFSLLVLLLLSADLIISVQLNANSTVITDFHPGRINKSFKVLPSTYPIPSLAVNSSENNDANLNPTIPGLWKNLGVYHKLPSSDGRSDYGYINQSNALRNGTYDAIIDNPLLFMANEISEMGIVDTASINPYSSRNIGIMDFDNNGFEVRLAIDNPGYLVCLQNYHPDWEVIDNDKKLEVIRVNETFMAVKIEKGKHDIRFRFSPDRVIYFAWISIVSWLGLILFLAVSSLRTGKKDAFFLSLALLVALSLIFLGIRIVRQEDSRYYEKLKSKIKQESNGNMESALQILNVDRPSEITDPGSDTKLVSIDVREDIAELISLLEEDEQDHLFYGHVNKIRYPFVDYIIEDYYPGISEINNMGNAYWILATRNPKEQKQNIESFNGFEGEVPLWNLKPEAMDSLVSFSGSTSFRFDTNMSFSSTYRNNYSDFIKSPKKAVFVSVAVKSESEINSYLVFQVNRGGEIIEYVAEGFEKFYIPGQTWYKAFLLAEIEYRDIRPDDLISVYVWNPDGYAFWIDEITLKSY